MTPMRVLLLAGAALVASGVAAWSKPLRLGEPVALGDLTVRLTTLESLPVVEDDYTQRFRFDRFENGKLAELRDQYRLDEAVSVGRDEFDRQIHLMDWVHRQFRSFGRPSKDVFGALEVLEAIEEGHRFFCTQYAQVMVSAAASLGWVDRPLALRRHQGVNQRGGSTEHTTTEIWSNQFRKWVMLDPTSNMYLEKDGIPLNAWEIREEWFYRDGRDLVFVVGKERKRYRKAQLPIVLGRFEGFGELAVDPDELDKYGFIGYIPNTNLMDEGFDYGRMFIVKDSLCDGTRWHTRDLPPHPATDAYFPIGQAELGVAVEDGELMVSVATNTPNLERIEVRLDGGEWKASEERVRWEVRAGVNRLEARTVNRFGVCGPVSTAVVQGAQAE